MSILSDIELRKLNSLNNQGGFWYITKQNLVFRDLCFMSKILDDWNDRPEENYESFFNNHKILPEYGELGASTAHRATKNCEYLGLIRPSERYSAQNLTPFYFALKDLCNGDFNKLSSYPNIIDKQLERIFIDSSLNSLYTSQIQICPFMFLFKILLLIGDITNSYKITIQEFKLFVATAQTWKDYFAVVESILRYRSDADYRNASDANLSKVSDVRYNILAQNHSQLEVTSAEIAIKEGSEKNIRRKVAEYELNDALQSAEDIFSADLVLSPLTQTENSSYAHLLTALRTKPFVLLAGISGTGKSRIVRELAKACWKNEEDEFGKNCPRNFCMVQVKPNWHDSSELMGYVSRIGEKPVFVAGDFLKFVARAWQEPEKPYFLCLDEMNLAPVEQYFAEYLSVIESRKLNADGTITTDPILKKEAEEWYHTLICSLTGKEELRVQFLNNGIAIPQNLFVIGTVNMDETTFSFSRKVLDRAMTIEMNEVDLHGGLDRGALSEFGYIGDVLKCAAVEGKDVYEDNKELCDKVIEYLEKINAELESTPFKIAYRTRNEFLVYAVSRGEENLANSLDEMTSMKILSRIEGDADKIGNLLDRLETVIKQSLTPGNEELTLFDESTGAAGQAEKSISLEKLKEMKARMASGYVSFWS